ncbi:MAG: hypothetical protein IIZ78_05790 [Clostridiales bacterium]|nr:hypothetical protein [Clostridiales bacterium]
MGIKCPNCRHKDTFVYAKYGDKRYRECHGCGEHFTTIERYDRKTINEMLKDETSVLKGNNL